MSEAEDFEFRLRMEREAAAQAPPASVAALQDPQDTLSYKMRQAGAQPAQSLPAYAAQSLLEGAPSAIGAMMGAAGGIPGMAAGAGAGEMVNQARKTIMEPASVMPGVQKRVDLAPVATTAAMTAAVPSLLVGGSKVFGALKDKFVSPLLDLFETGGEKHLATTYIKNKLLGEESLQPIINAAKAAHEIIPGSKPTMAQVVSHLPEGSPIQAHQAVIAKMPQGVSASFGERNAKQQVAESIAERYRNTMTVPKGLAALERANAQGGVALSPILQRMDAATSTPEVQGAPASMKALESVKEFLASKADAAGNIDAKTLYQFKKEGLDQVVDTAFDKTSPKVSEKFKAKNLIEVKNAIDDAIESGGGTGWKDYLKEYAGRSQNIADAMALRENQYKPLQRTNLTDPEVAKLQIANVLDRPISYINAALRHFRGDVRPRLNQEFAHLYQDPQYFAQQMEHVPVRYRPMVEALMRQTGPLTAFTSSQAQQ